MTESDGHVVKQIFGSKWIANGFPKSGTHLLSHMLYPIAPFQEGTEGGYFEQPWAATFRGYSWTLDWVPVEQICFRMGRIGNGKSVKAHLGHDPKLAEFIRLLGALHVFIYRDLRDVAVSQAFHILNASDERLAHPAPEKYDREDFDALLLQVIEGHAGFPGLVERWEAWAPWLDEDWTIPVTFENLREDPKRYAKNIFVAGMQRAGQNFGVDVDFDPHGVDVVTDTMVQFTRQDASPTFRKGKVGGWREHFKECHVEALKATGGYDWLYRLGYERTAA